MGHPITNCIALSVIQEGHGSESKGSAHTHDSGDNGKDIDHIANSMSTLPYEKAVELLNSRCKNKETIDTLRGRFRSYAYKQRKRLVSISISADVKSKLDDIGKKAGTSSSSDTINYLIQLASSER